MNKDNAESFCNECQNSYENFLICNIALFNLPSAAEMTEDKALRTPLGFCINRVAIMCYDSWITQVVRLDDPAKTRNNKNLSIHRVIEAEDWTSNEKNKLQKLSKELGELPKHLKPARDKIISHNDLKIRESKQRLGEFDGRLVKLYYRSLADLANMVREKWCLRFVHSNNDNDKYVFDLETPIKDPSPARLMAEKLRDCLCRGLKEQVKHVT